VLILVRHGRTAANAAGLLQGRADHPLDEVGQAQAARIAAALADVDRVVSSPLARARQTAAHLGRDVEVDDRWRELDYGEFEGRPLHAVSAQDWAKWRGDPHFAPPGGESLLALHERVCAALDELAAAARRDTVVVVSHVSPIKSAVAWALGTGVELSWRITVDQASISRVLVGPQGAVLRAFNETGHLAGLDGATSGG
jgi:probable phosphoglycerate mutase